MSTAADANEGTSVEAATGLDGEQLILGVTDSRRIMTYLVVRESDDYVAIMDVLEASVTDLTPAEVAAALNGTARPLDVKTVETRLDSLRTWRAVSARTDTSQVQKIADLLSRNWRYTATPAGRQAQRFYRDYLADVPILREIPLTSLARVVSSLDALVACLTDDGPGALLTDKLTVERVGVLFTSHDDLDGALVGAEDALATLADRFDLDDDRTSELKSLLVDYATRTATELESGSARAARALTRLCPYFADLADLAVASSHARVLIARGALTASRGGRTADWNGLHAWFDASSGRAYRFSLRLVRALPGMHANMRRLHASSGTASGRSRALSLARACADPALGTQIWQAALGDHPWRKLHECADDDDLTTLPPWRTGPQVTIPDLLRSTGRTGPRGKGGPARDDTQARADVERSRQQRRAVHDAALREVLAAEPGALLSENAARVALNSLMAAVRSGARGPLRTATREDLACSVIHTGTGAGVLRAPTWHILLPGRHPLFHLRSRRPNEAALTALSAVATPDPTPTQPAIMIESSTSADASAVDGPALEEGAA